MEVYTTRQVFSSNIAISHCAFLNIVSNINMGGALSVSGISVIFNLKLSSFQNCSSSSYSCGSIYSSCYSATISKICVYNSQSLEYCSALWTQCNLNVLEESSLDYCGQAGTRICAWGQSAGDCYVSYLNNSRFYATERESAGHFSSSPPKTEIKFSYFISCSGPYVLGPYSPISNHYNCIFAKNTPSVSLIVVWEGNHYLNQFLFIQNIQTISSSGHASYYIGFINCIGDQAFVGVQNSLQGSIFKPQIVTEYPLSLYKCSIDMSLPKGNNRSIPSLTFILYLLFISLTFI